MLVHSLERPFIPISRRASPRGHALCQNNEPCGHRAGSQVGLRAALGGDDIVPVILERRFAVDVTGPPAPTPEPTAPGPSTWLENLPAGGVRDMFAHIERFGAINEADATLKLGGPRHFRCFASRFEHYAEQAPFELRIDVASGQKRYLRG